MGVRKGSKRSFAPPFGTWDYEPRITSKPLRQERNSEIDLVLQEAD